jgi:uncharacterized RDD family membrane protein YckC
MSSESEEPRKAGPPPPSIASKPATPPPPSIPAAPATPPPSAAPAVKVKVKEGSDEDELDTPREDDGSAIPVGTRVLAAVIDIAIGVSIIFVVKIVAAYTLGFVGMLAWPLFLAFMLLRDGLPMFHGQSPGKAAMKIKAVTVSGESLEGNWQPVLVRSLALVVFPLAIIELVVLLTREDKPDQGIRLGDEWAKTRVVRTAPPVALEEESA